MSDYPMLISNKLHSFRNFWVQIYKINLKRTLSYVTKTFPVLLSVRLTIRFLF